MLKSESMFYKIVNNFPLFIIILLGWFELLVKKHKFSTTIWACFSMFDRIIRSSTE